MVFHILLYVYKMAYNRYNSNLFAYNQADRNHDGVLDRHEFRNFLDFQNADRNHDGRVGLAEFANIAGMLIVIFLNT